MSPMPQSILTLAALATLAAPAQAQRDSTMLRPTDVIVRISNDADAAYNGVYRASAISTKCGLADYSFPHRANSFAVIFPDDPTAILDVTSVNFDADTLPAGTIGNSFYLAVGIRVGRTGTPPAYVVRANKPQFNEPGTAERARSVSGVDSLTVVGTATKGSRVKVEMTLVCQPAP